MALLFILITNDINLINIKNLFEPKMERLLRWTYLLIQLKNNYEKKLSVKNFNLKKQLELTEHKNKLLSGNPDLDYLDTLYRTKLKFGKKNEVLIKLN